MGTETTFRPIARILIFFIILIVMAGCSSKGGRVAIVLDNSGSMASTGTSFDEIKLSLLNALSVVPSSHEKGLRVFDDRASRLVAPYRLDVNALRSQLAGISPQGGTYIGESLKDIARDLLERPGDNRFVFITDGEGNDSDIEKAREAKAELDKLTGLGGCYECNFILFSTRSDPLRDTPIGKISEILGCNLTVPGPFPTASTLWPTLLRIFGFDFYWIWIIISAILYIILVFWSTYLVFDTQVAQGTLPRFARMNAIVFLLSMIPLIIGAHLMGLLMWVSRYAWWFVIVEIAVLAMVAVGFGKNFGRKGARNDSDPSEDPFA